MDDDLHSNCNDIAKIITYASSREGYLTIYGFDESLGIQNLNEIDNGQ